METKIHTILKFAKSLFELCQDIRLKDNSLTAHWLENIQSNPFLEGGFQISTNWVLRKRQPLTK